MVGASGADPHGSLNPDHDAEADLKRRQRDIREIGRQAVAAILIAAAMFVLLALLLLATGKF